MNEKLEPNEGQLSRLIRAARPEPDLPPRFQEDVWKRIAKAEAHDRQGSLLELFEKIIAQVLQPRLAMACLAVLLVAGGVTGAIQGTGAAQQSARDRYLASVAPSIFH